VKKKICKGDVVVLICEKYVGELAVAIDNYSVEVGNGRISPIAHDHYEVIDHIDNFSEKDYLPEPEPQNENKPEYINVCSRSVPPEECIYCAPQDYGAVTGFDLCRLGSPCLATCKHRKIFTWKPKEDK
jgi:hypothetical protein